MDVRHPPKSQLEGVLTKTWSAIEVRSVIRFLCLNDRHFSWQVSCCFKTVSDHIRPRLFDTGFPTGGFGTPSLSPDLAQSDFHLIGSLKVHLGSLYFRAHAKVQ
ncbi:hypothetical protein AVEN_151381-1 [Araneus ventricosus]|uniref:Uncharacterized protein n=1 Tax=Araneus ventricosus TaxID=182803 RepID=A0A4Y2C987_ARAVE|nr:hypothetical protein AVEN_151381-1 [Araneus ventricosus]